MEIKQRFVFHILMLILAGIRESLATIHVTVKEGDTLKLKCLRKKPGEKEYMEWRNNRGHTLFFNNNRGVADPRSRVLILDDFEFTVAVYNVTLQDEGLYRCLEYDRSIYIKRIRVNVLGLPKIERTDRDGTSVISCLVAVTNRTPALSWEFGGLEILSNNLLVERSNQAFAVIMLTVKPPTHEAKVKCHAKYKNQTEPFTTFTIIEKMAVTPSTVSVRSSTTEELKTEQIATATSAPLFSSTALADLSSISEVVASEHTTNSEPGSRHSAETASISTTFSLTSASNSSTGEEVHKNATNPSDLANQDKHSHDKKSSLLLILLVATLLACLLIVVIFFVMRLRRAHVAWKKENEESDQSVESSKSKASEEKQTQNQRTQGFWNTKFTEYKVEETQQSTENSEVTEDVIHEKQGRPKGAQSTNDKESHVKETEL